MSMASPKSKKKTNIKANAKNFQTLTSMFAKQKTSKLLKQIGTDDDDDDFVQITKIDTKKSKFFKRKSSEMQSPVLNNTEGFQTDDSSTPTMKKRKLSLRKFSARVAGLQEMTGSTSSDNSVIVLSDSPVKSPVRKLSNSNNLKTESLNEINWENSRNAETEQRKSLKSKSKSNIKENSITSGHNYKSEFKTRDNSTRSSNSNRNNLRDSDIENLDSSTASPSNSPYNSDITKTEPDFQNGTGQSNKSHKNENSISMKLPQSSQDPLKETTKKSTKSKLNNNDKTDVKTSTKTKSEKSQKNPAKAKPTSSGRNSTDVHDSQKLEDEETEDGVEKDGEDEEYRVPYYLENFNTMLNSVMEDEINVKLFNKADLKIIDLFRNLSENGQKLYVRLFSRKLQWLNCNKIKYPNISEDLSEVIQELIDVDFVHSETDLTDLEETLKILPAPELKQLAKTYHINTAGQQKSQIIVILLTKTKQATITSMFGAKGGLTKAMLDKAKKHAGRCIKLKDERKVFVRVLMLFSVVSSALDEDNANGGQSQLFQMLMVNMGKVIYPEYKINKQTQIFPDRQHVLLYEKALQYEADMINFVEKSKWEEAYQLYLQVEKEFSNLPKKQKIFESKLPDFLRRYTVGHQLVRILSQGIEILQRRKDYQGAIKLIESLLYQQIYCLDYHGYWWERCVLNLDAHLKKPLEALELVKIGMEDENVRGGHRLALFQRAEKICHTASLKIKHRLTEFTHDEVIEAPKTTIEGRIIPYSLPGVKHKFMTQDSYFSGEGLDEQVTMCNVEQVVLDYYKQDYPEGLHAEGAIISTLFSLFFWNIIFMDVPDAFHSLYQTNPLDKMSLEFYRRRKTEINNRLEWLENSSIEELNERSRETWEKNCDKTCAGINWERLQSIEYIQGLIGCIGGKLLSGILARYAKDPRHTRSGFPDLTLWNIENKTFKIVEVKGPGDRLSHKQILWLSYLLKLGVDAEVCHVKAVGAKKLKAGT